MTVVDKMSTQVIRSPAINQFINRANELSRSPTICSVIVGADPLQNMCVLYATTAARTPTRCKFINFKNCCCTLKKMLYNTQHVKQLQQQQKHYAKRYSKHYAQTY